MEEMTVPNPCALVTAAAKKFLRANSIPCLTLEIGYEKNSSHVITVYEDSGLHGYDEGGTTSLPKKLNWKSAPLEIALAWVKHSRWHYSAVRAKWNK